VVAAKLAADGFDNEIVVLALGEAGDGDGADDAGSGDLDREAAAVGGVVGVGQGVPGVEGQSCLLQRKADGVGAAIKAGDDVVLALHPAGVVGRSAGHGGVEERLVRLAEAADVDDDGVVAGDGKLAQRKAEAPGGFGIEGGKDEFCFLAGDGGEVVGDGHRCSIVQKLLDQKALPRKRRSRYTVRDDADGSSDTVRDGAA
jgi:hypothetical protein